MEQVAYYEVAQVGQRRSLAYAVKQMLAREIEVQKMRLYEASLGPIAAEPDQKAVLPAAAVAAEVKPAVPNHLVLKLQPKAPKGAVGPVKVRSSCHSFRWHFLVVVRFHLARVRFH